MTAKIAQTSEMYLKVESGDAMSGYLVDICKEQTEALTTKG